MLYKQKSSYAAMPCAGCPGLRIWASSEQIEQTWAGHIAPTTISQGRRRSNSASCSCGRLASPISREMSSSILKCNACNKYPNKGSKMIQRLTQKGRGSGWHRSKVRTLGWCTGKCSVHDQFLASCTRLNRSQADLNKDLYKMRKAWGSMARIVRAIQRNQIKRSCILERRQGTVPTTLDYSRLVYIWYIIYRFC